MVRHLASLAEERIVISFAPYTPYYAVLKRIGELFPGPSKVFIDRHEAFDTVNQSDSFCKHTDACVLYDRSWPSLSFDSISIIFLSTHFLSLLSRPHVLTCMQRRLLSVLCRLQGSRLSSVKWQLLSSTFPGCSRLSGPDHTACNFCSFEDTETDECLRVKLFFNHIIVQNGM